MRASRPSAPLLAIQNASGGASSSSWIQPNEKGEDPTDWPNREFDKDGKLN